MKYFLRFLSLCIVNYTGSVTAEVLMKLSDDTTPLETEANPVNLPGQSKLTYKVICSPDEEALPDCQQSTEDKINLISIDEPQEKAKVQDKPIATPEKQTLADIKHAEIVSTIKKNLKTKKQTKVKKKDHHQSKHKG